MPKFQQHIFVCSNQRSAGHSRGCCDAAGSDQLRATLKAELKRRNLTPLVRANQAGCLDQCEDGPVLVIYPQAIWYGNVRLEDVPRIVEQTIVQGIILEDLRIPDEVLNTKGGKVQFADSDSDCSVCESDLSSPSEKNE